MTRILHCITGLNVGGAESMLMTYIGELRPPAWETTVLSLMPPGPLADRAGALGVSVATANMAQGRPSVAGLRAIRRRFDDFQPDVAHGWMYHGNLAATFGAARLGGRTPTIWSIHHSLSDISNEKAMTQALIRLSAAASRTTHAISYCSRASADQHERLGFDSRRRVVIPNGTDCDRFKPDSGARARLLRLLGVNDDRLLIGHVGRAHPMKDQARLVQAVAALLRDGCSVHAVIIGAGHEGGPAQRAARDAEIADNVTFLGMRDNIADLTPGFDAFALSSAWGEAFPLAAAEAMACGVPVVATDVGDCAWLVGDTGRVAKPADTESLVSSLRDLLSLSPDERSALGARARRRIVDEFGLAQYVRRHVDLYESALEVAGERR